ncbi:MAG TPA: hypothetical protein VG994_09305 [Steroidobacteraceae bacterium]|nr:hypothetical protein [Steroidobacteraceae bacterium]
MTVVKRVSVVLSAAVVVAATAWAFLLRERSEELSALKSMLPGAEMLKDAQLISKPSVIRASILRRWVFFIDSSQKNRRVAQCRSLKDRFPKNEVDDPVGCVAAYYNDPSAYRYVTLSVHPQTAELSALYMSATDFSAMVSGSFR